jgi:hypothetical protein
MMRTGMFIVRADIPPISASICSKRERVLVTFAGFELPFEDAVVENRFVRNCSRPLDTL